MRTEEKFRAGQSASFSPIYDAGIEKPGGPSEMTAPRVDSLRSYIEQIFVKKISEQTKCGLTSICTASCWHCFMVSNAISSQQRTKWRTRKTGSVIRVTHPRTKHAGEQVL